MKFHRTFSYPSSHRPQGDMLLSHACQILCSVRVEVSNDRYQPTAPYITFDIGQLIWSFQNIYTMRHCGPFMILNASYSSWCSAILPSGQSTYTSRSAWMVLNVSLCVGVFSPYFNLAATSRKALMFTRFLGRRYPGIEYIHWYLGIEVRASIWKFWKFSLYTV